MGRIQVDQVRKVLIKEFLPYVDVSDIENDPPEKIEQSRLTRALAAFTISRTYEIEPKRACEAIIDGRDDNGIDAIIYEPGARPTLVICQSKWSDSGKNGATLEAIIKLKEGISLLVSSRWDRFNARLQAKTVELETALENTDLKIDVIFASMGAQDIHEDLKRNIEDYLSEEFNDGLPFWEESVTASFSYLKQTDVHKLLHSATLPSPVDITVQVGDWGRIDEPHTAIYGHVAADDISSWMRSGDNSLLAGNVRSGLGSTTTNSRIEETARNDPDHFWYYNNGITLLCDKITKSPGRGSDRRLGMFEFKNVSLVNGAQTASTLAGVFKEVDPDKSYPRVMVRFISLENTPGDFGRKVSRATNTQNSIGGRDFVSLEPLQDRLKLELAIDDYKYVIKRGEERPVGEAGCDFVEAAAALASITSSDLATQAKREVGKLWEDVEKAPYVEIFPKTITHLRLQRAVEISRVVEAWLSSSLPNLPTKSRPYAIHGNKLLTFLVARQSFGEPPALDTIEDEAWNQVRAQLDQLCRTTFIELVDLASSNYVGYIAALFKNKTKTQELSELILERS